MQDEPSYGRPYNYGRSHKLRHRLEEFMRSSLFVAALASAFVLAGCNRIGADAKVQGAAPPAIQVTPEDVLVLKTGSLSAGRLVTGSIQPERRADLRA
jgi:membrane fusion protein (multidrug efflux system)